MLYGTLLLLCVTTIVVAHFSSRSEHRQNALSRLSTITSSAASQINADHVTLLLKKYDARGMLIKNTQDAWYYVMHDHLRKTAESNGLVIPLRVVAFDRLKQEVQVVATSAEIPEFRARFEQGASLDLAKNFSSTKSVLVHDALLAYEPLRNADGEVQGVVVATMPLAEAEAGAWIMLWRNIGIALLLFAIAGIALFRSVGTWVKQNEADREALASRQEDITDSLAYAGKIQRALIPSPEVYRNFFDDSFVIDKPKDMVSGDFHWYHQTGPSSCFIAAGDCTGHGLPGAMLAAIGCSLLNEIIPNNKEKDPGELLGLLNTRLVTTLHQQGQRKGAGDGLDIALCHVDREANEILFSGAFRPLFWLHHGQLTVINGDRRPIGGSHQELDRRFTTHRLAYEPGDRIYLFSDGYVDQFGGPERKRFMASRLHSLLNDNQALPMAQQADLLERTFLEWKGNEEQVDDVCMLGIAV